MLTEIRLPRLNANDTRVRLTAWLAPDGSAVSKGDPVCAVETTKASAELEAEQDGHLRHAASEGEEMEVGALVGWIGASSGEIEHLTRPPDAPSAARATARALRLAASLGIRIEEVPARGGPVREKDVAAFAGARRIAPSAPRRPGGEVDPRFLEAIALDPSFARLPSAEKIAAYRAAGAVIGEKVTIGEGALIVAERIEIGAEASVGPGARVRAESFALGRMSMIGERASVMARQIHIGDVLYMGGDVLIGGGGAWGETSRLVVGDLCLISRHCVLDCGSGIFIGDEVGISPHVKLFTHNHWQNVLEGYHANFGPIVIEDRAYVTGDALVVPNVRIGEGATVLANSTVGSDVEPYTVVSGNPARRVGRIERNIPVERKERILLRLLEEMKTELAGRLPADAVGYVREVDLAAPGPARVTLCFACRGDEALLPRERVVFDLSGRRVLGEQGAESDEVRNFLRRRGIRFSPIHWRYTRDAGLHNA